jgi:putative ABC transport system substrate-binding protein
LLDVSGVAYEAAIKTFAREPGSSLIAAADVFINTRRGWSWPWRSSMDYPVIYPFRQFVAEGALISYGPDSIDSSAFGFLC